MLRRPLISIGSGFTYEHFPYLLSWSGIRTDFKIQIQAKTELLKKILFKFLKISKKIIIEDIGTGTP
jgi:hypothetical protein